MTPLWFKTELCADVGEPGADWAGTLGDMALLRHQGRDLVAVLWDQPVGFPIAATLAIALIDVETGVTIACPEIPWGEQVIPPLMTIAEEGRFFGAFRPHDEGLAAPPAVFTGAAGQEAVTMYPVDEEDADFWHLTGKAGQVALIVGRKVVAYSTVDGARGWEVDIRETLGSNATISSLTGMSNGSYLGSYSILALGGQGRPLQLSDTGNLSFPAAPGQEMSLPGKVGPYLIVNDRVPATPHPRNDVVVLQEGVEVQRVQNCNNPVQFGATQLACRRGHRSIVSFTIGAQPVELAVPPAPPPYNPGSISAPIAASDGHVIVQMLTSTTDGSGPERHYVHTMDTGAGTIETEFLNRPPLTSGASGGVLPLLTDAGVLLIGAWGYVYAIQIDHGVAQTQYPRGFMLGGNENRGQQPLAGQ